MDIKTAKYTKGLIIRAEDKPNHIQKEGEKMKQRPLFLLRLLFFLIKVTLRQGKVFLVIQNVHVLIV